MADQCQCRSDSPGGCVCVLDGGPNAKGAFHLSGHYYFIDRTLGPLAGTIAGIGTWIVMILKSAFALIGMGAYGERVSEADGLRAALRRAQASGKTAVIHVDVDPVAHMWAPELRTFKDMHLEPQG